MNARIKRKVNENKIFYLKHNIFCACVNHTEFEDNKFIVPQKTVIQWRDLLGPLLFKNLLKILSNFSVY